MKNIFIYFILLLTFFASSCEKNKAKEEAKVIYWDEIEIFTRTQKITIRKDSDNAIFEKRISSEQKNKIESKSFFINQKERDTLHKLVYKMITKPVFTDKDATCYAGYVLIRLRDRNTSLACEYRSVGEWSTVSPETQKIYQLLSPKIEISSQ